MVELEDAQKVIDGQQVFGGPLEELRGDNLDLRGLDFGRVVEGHISKDFERLVEVNHFLGGHLHLLRDHSVELRFK